MPQQATQAAPDFIPAEPDFIPADGGAPEAPVQKQTTRAGGAGGSWEPATPYEHMIWQAQSQPGGVPGKRTPEEETLRREAGAAASVVGGVLKSPFQIAASPLAHPKVTPEEQKYGFRQDAGPAGRFGQEIGRQMFVPTGEAAGWWKQHLSDRQLRSRLIDDILSVAPEAVGTGAGTVLGGKTLEAGAGTAAKVTGDVASTYGVGARGAKGIEAAVAKHGEAAAEEIPIRTVLDEIMDMGRHGHTVPDVVKKIQTIFNGLDKAKEAEAPGGGIIEGETPEGLSFGDLRKMRTALDAKIDWGAEGKTTQMERLVKKLRYTMDKEEIKSVYRAGGASDASAYVKAKQNYAKAQKLQAAGGKIGAAVGGAVGMIAGSEVGKPIGHPWIAGSAGASIGGAAGFRLGRGAMKAITEAGMPKESMSAAEAAASELKTEKSSSVQAARDRGAGSMSNLGLENILRRSNIPEAEQAKIRQIIQQNEQMRRTRDLPKDPDAPTPEIMARGKAAYEQKYGKPKPKAPEYGTKAQPTANTPEATAWHKEAMDMARKELGPAATVSEVLRRAAEIQKRGRQ